jgi:dipeptidase D
MEIMKLEPQAVWKHFHSLTQIPRPSKKEARVIEFMKEFGKKLGLETLVDETGNVIIRKPATRGMENRKGIILQGHLDMVPQKNSDTVHDFEKDPIQAFVDGEWVKARGTTLGSDNGMGVAASMAILESKDLAHGPVEALFTVDEETGMTGAVGLKAGLLKGDILLNLDSEDEGELYIGCAGGINAKMEFAYQEEKIRPEEKSFLLSVSGLRGGHSGIDIGLGRGNSNKIVFRLLKTAVEKYGVRVAGIEGGNLRNAIPREAFVTITVPASREADFRKFIAAFEDDVRKELSGTEPDLKIGIKPADLPASVMDDQTLRNLINAVYGCPNGVMRMSDAMPGLVETSNNLAIVKSENGRIAVHCLLRSSVDTAKEDLASMIESVFTLAGAKVSFDGGYPGWKPNPASPILNTMKKIYQDKFGKMPEVKAIHAGLECGLLGAVYPHWDMISFGPTIRHPHSPDEKVNIASVKKFWDFLVETLKNVPAK